MCFRCVFTAKLVCVTLVVTRCVTACPLSSSLVNVRSAAGSESDMLSDDSFHRIVYYIAELTMTVHLHDAIAYDLIHGGGG